MKPEVFTIPGGEHALLSASGADRWMACIASVRLGEGIDTTREAAVRGTVQHWLAEQALAVGDAPENYLGKVALVDSEPRSWEIPVTQAMVDEVNFALDTVTELVENTGTGDEILTETDLTPELRRLHPDLGGTADVILRSHTERKVWVIDFKFGRMLVEAEGNTQLAVYALGAALRFPEAEKFHSVIIMPKWQGSPYAFQVAELWWDELLLDFASRLVAAALANRNAKPVTGPHCRWCSARSICPAVEKLRQLSNKAEPTEEEKERIENCGALHPPAGHGTLVWPERPAVSDFEPLD